MGLVNNIKTSINGLINKAYAGETGKTVRPSITQPYMSTDTGAKLPIFPFPLIMIYELANNIDALRIPIETINREMSKTDLKSSKNSNTNARTAQKSLNTHHYLLKHRKITL